MFQVVHIGWSDYISRIAHMFPQQQKYVRAAAAVVLSSVVLNPHSEVVTYKLFCLLYVTRGSLVM